MLPRRPGLLGALFTLVFAGSLLSTLGTHARQGPVPLADTPGDALVEPGELVLDRASPEWSISALPAAALPAESFEGSWPGPGWSLSGGAYTWGRRNCRPHGGQYAAWVIGGGSLGTTLACDGTYPNSANIGAVYGPFSLVGATSARLRYYVYGRTEGPAPSGCVYDSFFVGSSVNATNFYGMRACGNFTGGAAGNGYYEMTLDLADRLGQSQVWIAFALVTDSTVSNIGITIDDVSVQLNGTGTATPTGTATRTPTPTVTRTPTPTATREAGGASSTLYLALLRAGGAQGAPPPTPTRPPAPGPGLKLDVCREGTTNLLKPGCQRSGSMQYFMYPGVNTHSFAYTLPGDIAGTAYSFNLYLASRSTTTFEARVLLRRGAVDTPLASQSFTASSTVYTPFTATVAGVDPEAQAGDQIVLQVSATGGDDGGMVNSASLPSSITIPAAR